MDEASVDPTTQVYVISGTLGAFIIFLLLFLTLCCILNCCLCRRAYRVTCNQLCDVGFLCCRCSLKRNKGAPIEEHPAEDPRSKYKVDPGRDDADVYEAVVSHSLVRRPEPTPRPEANADYVPPNPMPPLHLMLRQQDHQSRLNSKQKAQVTVEHRPHAGTIDLDCDTFAESPTDPNAPIYSKVLKHNR